MRKKKKTVTTNARRSRNLWDPLGSWEGPEGSQAEPVTFSFQEATKNKSFNRMDFARLTELQSQKYWSEFFSTLDDLCVCDDIPLRVEQCLTDLFLNFFSDYAQIDFDADRVKKGWKQIPEAIISEIEQFRDRTKDLKANKEVDKKIAVLVELILWFAWNLEVGINGLPADKSNVQSRNRPRKMVLRQFFVWQTEQYQRRKPGRFLEWREFKLLMEENNSAVKLRGDEIYCSERSYRDLKKEFREKNIHQKVQ